jgi:hypothetical protein
MVRCHPLRIDLPPVRTAAATGSSEEMPPADNAARFTILP